MITYTIRYEAENRYNHDVQEALFEFMVLPCDDHTQEVVEEETENSLQLPTFRIGNMFGYHSIGVRIAQPFRHFRISVSCKVRKQTEGILHSLHESLPLAEEQKILQSEEFLVDQYLYIRQTPLTALPADTVPAQLLYQRDQPLFSYLQQLNTAIYQMMVYKTGVTTPATRACDVVQNPTGVCQDYSHLMLGILRQQQLPCRYVSGYLNQGQQFMGSAQMHAWIEGYVPHMGWVGFDPTNNLMADQHHIKVSDGTDYKDCSPLKGHIKPLAPNSTKHTVQVVEQQ